MSEGIDFKSIGLAAKDIVLGIAGAAAGATGGAAGAEAVNKIDKGLDKVMTMAAPEEKSTRGDRMDRADKPAPKPAVALEGAAPLASAAPPASAAEVAASQGRNASWPPTGEAKVTADHLTTLGWSRERIKAILGGPDGTTTLAELTQDRPTGFVMPTVEGTRLASVQGQRAKAAQGEVVPAVQGQRTPTVASQRAVSASTVRTAAAATIKVVDARRVDGKGGANTA